MKFIRSFKVLENKTGDEVMSTIDGKAVLHNQVHDNLLTMEKLLREFEINVNGMKSYMIVKWKCHS